MHTLLSIFEDAATAKRARDSLQSSGIEPHNMHLEEGAVKPFSAQDPDDSIEGVTSSGDVVVDRGLLPSFGHVVASMFGLDHPDTHANNYADAVRSGKTVLICDTADEKQATAAAAIARQHGAESRSMPRVSKTPLRDLVARRQVEATH